MKTSRLPQISYLQCRVDWHSPLETFKIMAPRSEPIRTKLIPVPVKLFSLFTSIQPPSPPLPYPSFQILYSIHCTGPM